jgi:hypothetical protein
MNTEEIIEHVSPSRRVIKKIKIAFKSNKVFNIFYTYIYYIFIRRKCQKIIENIDNKIPLGGLLKFGYLYFQPNNNIFDIDNFQNMLPHKSIELTVNNVEGFNKIFDFILPICVEYLGDEIIIDSMCITKITQNDISNISANWHTDNVGHNLKIYLCIDGDGSIVTKYLPGTNLKKYKANRLEDLRMIGFINRRKNKYEVDIKHETGSVAIFDTNGLHRGAYTNVEKSRTVFEIEIANKSKAELLENIAPIGIRSGQNSFYITDKFLEKFKYNKYLDSKRLRRISQDLYIYGGSPTHYVIS